MKNEKIIVVDLEATCWRENLPEQRKNSEIIEIGICLLDTKSGEITKNEGLLIKPDHSEVSEFCEELTTISQRMIDEKGISLKLAIDRLKNEYNSKHLVWASYGAYDLNMFKRQCKSKNIDYPFGSDHLNVKEVFKKSLGIKKNVGMKKALNILKIKLEGTHHRGVDDARNIAKILYKCL